MDDTHDENQEPPRPIAINVGRRFTTLPTGFVREHWPDGSPKNYRVVHSKRWRRIIRKSALIRRSSVGRQILEAQRLRADALKNTDNGYEARRLLTAELADRKALRVMSKIAKVVQHEVQP